LDEVEGGGSLAKLCSFELKCFELEVGLKRLLMTKSRFLKGLFVEVLLEFFLTFLTFSLLLEDGEELPRLP
jgi:hypothetical protein